MRNRVKYVNSQVTNNVIVVIFLLISGYICKSQTNNLTKTKLERTQIMSKYSNEMMVQNSLVAFGLGTDKVTVVESRMTDLEQQIPQISSADSVLRIRINTGPLVLRD